jgi:hypothetical protein
MMMYVPLQSLAMVPSTFLLPQAVNMTTSKTTSVVLMLQITEETTEEPETVCQPEGDFGG